MKSPGGCDPVSRRGQFGSTHWSLILQARERHSPEAEDALATLCRAYWYPLYAYIRRRVDSPDLANDLTQEFFARLLEKAFLAKVDPKNGRFRAFLLACCNHFLANERDRERTQKRGGGRTILPLERGLAEERFTREPADSSTPERVFNRRWALTLLDQVLDRLHQEYNETGKGPLYEHLKGVLLGDHAALSHAQIAVAIGMTDGAVKKAAQRLRDRYRQLLRDQIAATVDGPDMVDEEIHDLFAALAE
jgi:RNA polymerase sigma-70 factor (ECF subfamily)